MGPKTRSDRRKRGEPIRKRGIARHGSSSLDYVLILGVVLPIVAFSFHMGPILIRAAYDMVSGLISWPFM